MTTDAETHAWLYLMTGSRTHYVNIADEAITSVCGVYPGSYWKRHIDWWGRRDDKDAQRAAGMERCRRCVALITRPDGTIGLPGMKTTS